MKNTGHRPQQKQGRKIPIILFFIFLSAIISQNLFGQWIPIGPVGNLKILSISGTGSIVFAGSSGNGVYISTNDGQSWTQTSLNYFHWVYAIALSGTHIFAGTNDSGVYLSTNNGLNWLETGSNYQWIWSLVISGNNIFAGTSDNGVYISTNNGQNWSQTSLNYWWIEALAINGNNIFAGTYGGGVYVSSNNGQDWIQTGLDTQRVTSLVTIGNNIFAGTLYDGIYVSINGGQNWTWTSLNNQTFWALAISGNIIFAGSHQNGVYVSTNNGTNWIQKNEGLSNLPVRSLYISSNYIYAGTDSIIYRRPLSDFIGIKPISTEIPNSFSLSQNYPNPFNPSTKIKFSLPNPSQGGAMNVTLKIYDILGGEVTTLVNEELKSGSYEYEWNGSNYASGVYFYKLETKEFSQTKKLVLLK